MVGKPIVAVWAIPPCWEFAWTYSLVRDVKRGGKTAL